MPAAQLGVIERPGRKRPSDISGSRVSYGETDIDLVLTARGGRVRREALIPSSLEILAKAQVVRPVIAGHHQAPEGVGAAYVTVVGFSK
jgi:hypothetical protein